MLKEITLGDSINIKYRSPLYYILTATVNLHCPQNPSASQANGFL